MTKISRNLSRFAPYLAAIAAFSCSNSQTPKATDSTSFLAESVVASINSALTADERTTAISTGTAGSAGTARFELVSKAFASSSCSAAQYSPTLGSLTCAGTASGETVTEAMNNCSINRGVDQFLRGDVTLTFDTPVTCGEWLTGPPTSGAVVWTSTDLQRVTEGTQAVTTSSQAVNNYKGASVGGGMKTTFGTPTSLAILGLHVLRQSTGNQTVADHSVSSLGALNVTGTLAAGTRTIATGVVSVDHNTLSYTAVGTITGLKWSSTCCVPSDGTIKFVLSGSLAGNIIFDFKNDTCGKVTVTDSSSPVTTADPSPSPVPSNLVTLATIGGCQ